MAYNSEAVTVYTTATGEIRYPTYRENGVNPTLAGGEALIEGHFLREDHYVLAGVATARPTLIDDEDENIVIDLAVSIGVNQTIIASMPIGTVVSTDGFYGVAASVEALQVLAEKDGTYEIDVVPPFPYKDLSITLVITDVD